MNLKRYIIFFLIFILLILLVPIFTKKREGLTTRTGLIKELKIGDTIDGVSAHLYSQDLTMRMIFSNGLRIQKVKFKKQIPQIEEGITDTGNFETHLETSDIKMVNMTAKSITFDPTGLTLYDKTLNSENDDNPIVIPVESERKPIKITDAKFRFDDYRIILTNNGDLVALNSANQQYPLLSKGVNRFIDPPTN
jgi:hypothetical protein